MRNYKLLLRYFITAQQLVPSVLGRSLRNVLHRLATFDEAVYCVTEIIEHNFEAGLTSPLIRPTARQQFFKHVYL